MPCGLIGVMGETAEVLCVEGVIGDRLVGEATVSPEILSDKDEPLLGYEYAGYCWSASDDEGVDGEGKADWGCEGCSRLDEEFHDCCCCWCEYWISLDGEKWESIG